MFECSVTALLETVRLPKHFAPQRNEVRSLHHPPRTLKIQQKSEF